MIYVVKAGDSLSIIARKYGQPLSAWKQLFAVNPQIGTNPDKIYPGMELTIPLSWSTGEKPGETATQEIVSTSKSDYTWLYWGGGLVLLYLAWKKRGRK